jgi:hypothetical protein
LHFAHIVPPQSLSDSSWLRVLSMQVGAWQALLVHTLLKQSTGSTHACPVGHPPQLRPQSTALSVPFCTPSVQVGG